MSDSRDESEDVRATHVSEVEPAASVTEMPGFCALPPRSAIGTQALTSGEREVVLLLWDSLAESIRCGIKCRRVAVPVCGRTAVRPLTVKTTIEEMAGLDGYAVTVTHVASKKSVVWTMSWSTPDAWKAPVPD